MIKSTKKQLTLELIREVLCTHSILDCDNIEKLAKYIADRYCSGEWTLEDLYLFLDHSNLRTYIGYNSSQFNTKLDHLIVNNEYSSIKELLIDAWPEFNIRDDLADQQSQINNLQLFQHNFYLKLYLKNKTVMTQKKYRLLPYFKKYKVECLNMNSKLCLYDIKLKIYRLGNNFPTQTLTSSIFP